MRENRFKVNVEVINKVNGKHYVITGVTSDKKAYAKEILERDVYTKKPVLGPDVIVISRDNALCFRVVYDPNEPDTPEGYSCENGNMIKDGEKVTDQGEIYVEKILGTIPLRLVLLTKGKGERHGIYTYSPTEDKFVELIHFDIDKVESYELQGGIAVIYSITENAPGKDNEEEKTLLKCSAIAFVDKSGHLTLIELETVGNVMAVSQDTLFMECSVKLDEKEGFLIPCEPYTLMVECNPRTRNFPVELEIAGVNTVTPCFIKNVAYVIKSEEAILLVDRYTDVIHRITDHNAIEALKAYDSLVDIEETIVCSRREVTLVFANKDYEMKVCNICETSDRGKIVTII